VRAAIDDYALRVFLRVGCMDDRRFRCLSV